MTIFSSLNRTDHQGFLWCYQHRTQSLIQLSKIISQSADGGLYVLYALVAFSLNARLAQAFCLAFFIERSLYIASKNLIRRHRPAETLSDCRSVIAPSDRFSLPSGHTSAAFLFAAWLTHFMPWLAILFFSWAACVAAARVILAVHFPSDTLAGASLGLGVAWWVLNRVVV